MIYMLDTNVIVRILRKPGQPIQKKVTENLGHVCISSVTYAELIYGVYKSADAAANMNAVLTTLSVIPILDFDRCAAEHFGEIFADLEKNGRRIGERDMMIAGHARSRDFILVTNNVREFSRVKGLKVEDWEK